MDLGVDGKAQAQISLGVAAQGTIVPPDLNDFAVTVGMDAVIDGTVDLSAGVSVNFVILRANGKQLTDALMCRLRLTLARFKLYRPLGFRG